MTSETLPLSALRASRMLSCVALVAAASVLIARLYEATGLRTWLVLVMTPQAALCIATLALAALAVSAPTRWAQRIGQLLAVLACGFALPSGLAATLDAWLATVPMQTPPIADRHRPVRRRQHHVRRHGAGTVLRATARPGRHTRLCTFCRARPAGNGDLADRLVARQPHARQSRLPSHADGIGQCHGGPVAARHARVARRRRLAVGAAGPDGRRQFGARHHRLDGARTADLRRAGAGRRAPRFLQPAFRLRIAGRGGVLRSHGAGHVECRARRSRAKPRHERARRCAALRQSPAAGKVGHRHPDVGVAARDARVVFDRRRGAARSVDQ